MKVMVAITCLCWAIYVSRVLGPILPQAAGPWPESGVLLGYTGCRVHRPAHNLLSSHQFGSWASHCIITLLNLLGQKSVMPSETNPLQITCLCLKPFWHQDLGVRLKKSLLKTLRSKSQHLEFIYVSAFTVKTYEMVNIWYKNASIQDTQIQCRED